MFAILRLNFGWDDEIYRRRLNRNFYLADNNYFVDAMPTYYATVRIRPKNPDLNHIYADFRLCELKFGISFILHLKKVYSNFVFSTFLLSSKQPVRDSTDRTTDERQGYGELRSFQFAC